MSKHKKAALAVLGLSATLFGGGALASTLSGTHVTYSFNDADVGLFGTASVSGDDLIFTPSSFEATSTGGIPDFAFQTLHIDVSANSGYQLSAFSLAESGGYLLSGVAAAGVTGTLTALDIEGTTSNNVVGTLAATLPFSTVGAATGWTANAGVTLPATGWGGTDGIVTSITLTLSNQLFATSVLGSADIWKDVVAIDTVATPVPEAETYAMMLVGLGLVGFMARRSARAGFGPAKG